MAADWVPLARAMVQRMAAASEVTDPAWIEAFETVPRHLFVPDVSLERAYAAESIVTQVRAAAVVGGGSVELPSSSASAPGAVAVMLDRLAVEAGQQVLEIGTGTGYNAALLCHRLGGAAVCSVDIDPGLVTSAGRVLASLGYRPTLVTGDGDIGLADRQPFDGIVATCAVDRIPVEWIKQLNPGGRIVAPLTGAHEAALMVLTKTAGDEVVGRFDPARVRFMPLRRELSSPLAGGGELGGGVLAMAHYGTTDLDPAQFIEPVDDFALFLHLHIAGLNLGTTEHPTLGKAVTVADGKSIAEVPLTADDRWTVLQRGPRRLWDTVEHAARLWERLGRPDRSRYGITALDDPTRQFVWLDDPDGPYSWPMPL
jgi:protein-L-isoaspartate(D-aspartate) O-methyltransferase